MAFAQRHCWPALSPGLLVPKSPPCRVLHAPRPRRQLAATIFSAAGSALYNRVREKRVLELRLANKPTTLLVLLGPPSCGKTALLTELLRECTREPRPFYVDCRARDYMSPGAFTENVLECIRNAWPVEFVAFLEFFGVKVPDAAEVLRVPVKFSVASPRNWGGPPTAGVEFSAGGAAAASSLQEFFDAFQVLAREAKEARKAGDPWPVIIIDEANALMDWEDKKSLKSLLAFFVRVTKQEQLAHVVLATSDTFFLQWLEKSGVNKAFREVAVVGNLSEAEAREFFFQHVLPSLTPQHACGEAEWRQVYEVCGGNPGALQACAVNADCLESWTLACEAILTSVRGEIRRASRPRSWEGSMWTRGNYLATVAAIAASEHGALSCDALEGIPQTGGEEAISSMVKNKLLLYRTYDAVARDVPAEAFGDDKEAVYMLPSVAHLVIARRMLEAGQLGGDADAVDVTVVAVQD